MQWNARWRHRNGPDLFHHSIGWEYDNRQMKTNGRSDKNLLLNVLYLLPLSLQILFPQADLVVSSTDSKDVSTRAPANPPQDSVEFQLLAGPLAGIRCIRGPDPHSLILRRRGDIGLGQNAG